jgi:hypothetical protein
MSVRHARLVLFTVAAAGCGDNLARVTADAAPDQFVDIDAALPVECVIGDITQPIELELGYRDPKMGSFVPITEMMPVPIVMGATGGFLMKFGVRARNVDCLLELATIALFDTCPGNELLEVESYGAMVLMESDGWGIPRAENYYMRVLAYPQSNYLQRDMHDVPYEIRLAIKDSGRTAEMSLHVVPYCADTDEEARALCECQCNRDYVLGGACPPESSGEPPVCDP